MDQVPEIRRKVFMKNKALVVFSGGIDSTVALYHSLQEYDEVEAVHFRYGSNHEEQESRCAKAITDKLNIPLIEIRLDFIKEFFNSSLLGGEIPSGAYDKSNMASTVVPFRNGIMLAVASGLAESRECSTVVLANHSGDHHLYPDCTVQFISAIDSAVKAGTDNKVRIESPFCCWDKDIIIKYGNTLGVDFANTYSCYKGGSKHCGVCGTCTERRESFNKAGVEDPTEYES